MASTVIYRGTATLLWNGSQYTTTVHLPPHASEEATDFSVVVSQKVVAYRSVDFVHLASSEVENGQFVVYGSALASFDWIVYGTRR